MKDQVDRLRKIPAIKAVYLGQGDTAADDILSGHFDYLYASPEALVSDKQFRLKLQQLDISTIVVDECHTVYTWGGMDGDEDSAFRKWFQHLEELRSIFPSACLLALSATCTRIIRKAVMKELGLDKDTTKLIVRSPEKPNIKFCVQKIDTSLEMSMQWLVDAFSEESLPRTLIYANSLKHVSDLYMYIKSEIPECVNKVEMFHSETPDEKKNKIIGQLQESENNLKLVIATSALGMGIDISNCHSLILYGIPGSVTDLIQEVGRIGRDGVQSVALLLYHKYHFQHANFDIKKIYTGHTCRRISIMKEFMSKSELDSLSVGSHTCCDVCSQMCKCGACVELLLEQYIKGPTLNESSSSDTDTI